jgi:hypothetical protein
VSLLSYSFFLLLNAVTSIDISYFWLCSPVTSIFAFLIVIVCTAFALKSCVPQLQSLCIPVAKTSSWTSRMVYPPQNIIRFWFHTTIPMSDWIITAVSFWHNNEALLLIVLLSFQVGAKPEGIYRSSRGTRRSGPLHGRDQQIAESSKPHRWWDSSQTFYTDVLII